MALPIKQICHVMFLGLEHSCLGDYLWHLGGLASMLPHSLLCAYETRYMKQACLW